MDKPLHICGARHNRDEPCVWPVANKPVVNTVVNEPTAVVNEPLMVVNAVVNRSKDRHKDKDARRVYMREYMAKRRACSR